MIRVPEKKRCAECGGAIVGIVPKWKDGKPVCRNCTFNYRPLPTNSPQLKINRTKIKPETVAPGNRKRVILWVLAFPLTIGIMVGVPLISSGVLRDEPLRRGGVPTDRLGDKCIKNLWELSKAMQENRLNGIGLSCPASGRPYLVTQTDDDTLISCPEAEAHRIRSIRASRLKPFPVVIP